MQPTRLVKINERDKHDIYFMHSLFHTQWDKVTGKSVEKSQICEIIFDFFLFST